jgi:hypothetical protein
MIINNSSLSFHFNFHKLILFNINQIIIIVIFNKFIVFTFIIIRIINFN